MIMLMIIVVCWLYPIIGYILSKLVTKGYIRWQHIFLPLTIIAFLTLLGLTFNFSTTSQYIDWFLVTLLYLLLSSTLWFACSKKGFLKALGIVFSTLTYGLGCYIGSFGLLGATFIIARYDCDKSIIIEKNIVYKEFKLGNAISDKRGVIVEIHRTIPILPIEWLIHKVEYNNIIPYVQNTNVNYDENSRKIYLSASLPDNKYAESKWSDTINLTY